MGRWNQMPREERVALQRSRKARLEKARKALAEAEARELERSRSLQPQLKSECLARHPEWRGSL